MDWIEILFYAALAACVSAAMFFTKRKSREELEYLLARLVVWPLLSLAGIAFAYWGKRDAAANLAHPENLSVFARVRCETWLKEMPGLMWSSFVSLIASIVCIAIALRVLHNKRQSHDVISANITPLSR